MNIDKDKTGIFLFSIALLFLVYLSYIAFSKVGIWYDEIYTIGMVQDSFGGFVNLALADVHPPLYYIIFKFFNKIAVSLNIHNIILVGKFVSILPFYLIFILNITKIRKNFGYLTMGIFSLLIVTMPQLMNFAVELRMYSWGLFFITASLLYVGDVLNNESNNKSWIMLTILTIASSYTHYFSAIASFSIYLFLLAYIIKNNKTQLKKYFISAVISVLAFLPWIFVVSNQVATINGNYWIKPMTVERLIGFIFYVFSPANEIINANEIAQFSILGLVLFIIVLFLIYRVYKSDKDFNSKFAVYGILIAIMVPIIGIVLSFLFTPILHPRYLIPVLGPFWFGVSILLSREFDKKWFIPIIILILIVSCVGAFNFTQSQDIKEINTLNKSAELQSIFGTGNVIIYDHFVPYFEMSSYYIRDNHHLSLAVDDKKSFDDTSSDIENVLNDPGIQSEIQQGSKVYFISYKHYDDNITYDNLNFRLNEIYPNCDVGNYRLFEVIIN